MDTAYIEQLFDFSDNALNFPFYETFQKTCLYQQVYFTTHGNIHSLSVLSLDKWHCF